MTTIPASSKEESKLAIFKPTKVTFEHPPVKSEQTELSNKSQTT
jgi:hypothetical protein